MNFDLIKSVINQETNKITIRGVIHIGPIDNDIIAFYKQQNINNILILEPNSFIYQSIQNYSIDPTITIANCLPSNENSTKTISFIHPSHIDKITSQEVTTRTIEQVIIDIMESGDDITDLTKPIKAKLLSIPVMDVMINNQRSPLMIAVGFTTASLAKCYAGEIRRISYPNFI